jgi:methionine-rich copper-binding protein CopC
VTFNVTVNNDNLLDGTQTATIRARGTGITEGSAVFTVTDHETLSLTFEDTTLREDNGAKATRGTIRRSNINIALPLVVTLTSSDTSELKVPSKVTIPAGSSSVSFDVDTVNDSVIDGTQSVTITAVATGYVNGTGKITVADHEPPVLTGPAASVTTSKPAITWKAVTGALRYDVLLRNMSSGIEQLYPGITKTTFTRTEPLGIGRYRVYVRAIDQLERAGFWSSLRDFKVETAPKITAPVIKPQVGSTFPEISWTAVIDAAGYELVVHNATTGTKNVISEKNLKTTSFRSTQSLGSGTYTAYVRAFNAKKEFGKWTPAYSFTVLGTPTMLTPVSGGTFDRIPLISWTAVAGATSYDVHLSNRTTGEIVFRDQHVTGTSVRVPRDLADGEYRLGVQAQFGSFYGNWPTARYFSVGTSPVTTSPKTGAHAGAKPKFVWTAISGAERYELHVRNLDTNAVVLLKTDITTTSYTMTSSLPLANYRVYVRAVSTMGEFTAWNKRVDFIGGATPKITSPAVNAKVAAKPTMAWSEVSGAVSYQVWVRDQETMKWVVKASNIKTNSYTLKTSLDSGKYRVWVRAVSAKGHVSAWSTGVDFRVSSSEQTTPSQDASVNGLLASVLYSADEEQQNSHVEVSDPGTQSTVSVTVAEATSSATESEAPVGHQELDAVMAGWDASEWWLAGQTPVADVGLAASVKAAVPGEKSRKI